MSYSDDYASPQAPFSGDDSGDIFDMPDVVWQPQSQERVVDTQSGFLIVIKRAGLRDNRTQLSFKRRVGTPPSSSVILTADESVKLSKILVTQPPDHKGELKLEGKISDISDISDISESVDDWLAQMTSEKLPPAANQSDYRAQREERRRKRNRATARRVNEKIQETIDYVVLDSRFRVVILLLCLVGLGGAVYGMSSLFSSRRLFAGVPTTASSYSEQAESKFASAFVTDLYDQNPEAKVRAMSKMSADAISKYASGSQFSLAVASSTTPKQSVLITRVEQSAQVNGQKDVDVQGELLGDNMKLIGKLHNKLKLQTKKNPQSEPVMQVIDWQDIK